MSRAPDWVTATGEGVTRRRVRCVRIKVLRGPDRGRSAVVDRTPFRIGGLPSNDLCLTDPTVSGHHAELVAEEGGYRVASWKEPLPGATVSPSPSPSAGP